MRIMHPKKTALTSIATFASGLQLTHHCGFMTASIMSPDLLYERIG